VRNAFADEITKLAANPSVVLLSGDIGNRLFESFKVQAPGRFLNCGVAEANLVGMAAGMAMCGLRPVAYTITPFITYRVMEQIRLDLCYHRLPVILVGTGSGLRYATLGASHHSLEEMAMLRTLPGMTVLAPADSHELRACLRDALKLDGPAYIRIGKKGEPLLHSQTPQSAIGRRFVLREGRDVCLLATGVIASTALEAAQLLDAKGLSAQVVSMPTVKPLNSAMLSEIFDCFPLVATMEEHGLIGGFGAAVAEWLADRETPAQARLLRFGTADAFIHEAGETEHALAHFNLAADSIAARIAAHMPSLSVL